MTHSVGDSHAAIRVLNLPRLILLCTLFAAVSELAEAATPSDTLIVYEALGITLTQRTPYSVIPVFPVAPWTTGRRTDAPKEGESLRLANGSEVTWQRIVSDSIGWFPANPPAERYAAVTIELKSPARIILEGMGHDLVCVNGTLRSGNPYQQADEAEEWAPHFDYSKIPLELREGKNLLLFRYTRGRLKVRVVPVTKPVAFNAKDVTRPDVVTGKSLDAWGSIALMNATPATLKGLSLISSPAGGKPDTLDAPSVPAMGMRKLAFRIRTAAPVEKGRLPVRLTLLGGTSRREVIDTVTVSLRIVSAEEPRQETFVSTIDGSVQYYAVTPPVPGFAERPALFFSLHGAGVEAINQARSYAPKKWGYVVAPTNRRPYGFSWEDWGRLDALEVLDLVTKRFGIDGGRIYLTGHSMGGHGTWFMGATYPDKFAAIGPSAGWITFQTYRFADAKVETSDVKRMLRRAASSSDLFSLAENYRHFGIYILHGATDDNVPPQQSYMMLDHLKPFHRDFVYYEQPGQGHWWDVSPEPGADCVDWKPMFDFFSRHARPGSDRTYTVDFTTTNPGISNSDGWLSIDAQEHQLQVSSARLQLDTDFRRARGTTTNVARFSIDRRALGAAATATVEIDSQSCVVHLDSLMTDAIWFGKQGGKWRQVNPQTAAMKNARRYGTLKEAFRNKMALVYGTTGTKEENSWAFTRARYDAEKLWYQGNASVDVLADTEFVPSKEPDRNVILYGNSRTHRLWKALLPGCPIVVDRGRIVIGEESVKRSDVCCLFTRPRPGSEVASVGVVSGTGIEGFALSSLVLYLEPGLGLPDLTVFNSDVLTRGDAGVMLTGFFGLDWSVPSGEFATGQPGEFVIGRR
jgi:dienelactone hydrolase